MPLPSIAPSTAELVRFSADRRKFDDSEAVAASGLASWALAVTSNGVMGGAVQRATADKDEGSRGMERARVRCIEVGDKTAAGAMVAEALCGEEEKEKEDDSDGQGNEVNKSDESVGWVAAAEVGPAECIVAAAWLPPLCVVTFTAT
jgi:hypothetical protein